MGTVRLFKHHIHTAYLWMAFFHWALFVGSVYLAIFIRLLDAAQPVAQYLSPIFPKAIVFATVGVFCFAAMGLYKPRIREGAIGILIRVLSAFLLQGFVLALIFYIFPVLLLWRGPFVMTMLFAFLFSITSRTLFSKIVAEEGLKRRVLVYGAGHNANKVVSRLRRKSDRRGFRFVGFVHVPHEQDVIDSSRILHLDGSICEYAKANKIDGILVAVDDRRRGLPTEDLLDCKLNGVEVMDVVTFFEREVGKIMVEFVTPGWMIFSDGFGFGAWRSFSKRAFDLIASFLIIMVTWPLMLLVVIAIWIEDGVKASIVYRQKRVGLDGKEFYVLKFRSMSVDAEKDGQAVWARQSDDRVTKVGRIIRSYRIDELPQIINVLAGEMGFVGPRPERPEFVSKLTKKIPYYTARHQVKPGIAGWAQLCYPYGANENDAEQKLQFDLYYVKNHSLFLDFLILLQTVEVVLMGNGER